MPDPHLTPAQNEVLLAMNGLGEYMPYVRTIARECALPVEQVRQIIRYFDSLGWVTHGPVCDADTGQPKGSTWWLTDKGLAAKQARENNALAAKQAREAV